MARDNDKPAFQTHIPEPRWQQVLSVIIAALAFGVWLWLTFWHSK